MKTGGKFTLFSDEESTFLVHKHQLYSKQLASKRSDKFKCKKDVWDQISLDIQCKFNKMISSKQCATRIDTIQKRGRRKRAKMKLKAKRNNHYMQQYLKHDNSNISFDGSNGAASNSMEYLNDGQPQTGGELITAPDCFYTINYPQPHTRIPAESLNPLSIISSVGLSRRPNILTPPVSTASSSSNNEITSTTLASTSAPNPDVGEVPFLKKSLEKEREIVRTLQLQISHYESYIEILLQRISDLDKTQTNRNGSTNEESSTVKQEPA